jgi:hypothetical protein
MLSLRAAYITRTGNKDRLNFAAVHWDTVGEVDLQGRFNLDLATLTVSIVDPEVTVKDWQVYIRGEGEATAYLELDPQGGSRIYVELGSKHSPQRLELEGWTCSAALAKFLDSLGAMEFPQGSMTLEDYDAERLVRYSQAELQALSERHKTGLCALLRDKRKAQEQTESLLEPVKVEASKPAQAVAGLRPTVDGLDNFPEVDHV